VPANSLFGPDNSLLRPKEIPVPPGTGNGTQATENAEKFKPKSRPEGRFPANSL
jgi:hypothetical protein